MLELWEGDVDCVVFLQTIEHVQDPDAVLDRLRALVGRDGVAYVSTPNVLTLAPEGEERSGNPWHIKEYRAEEFRALCERHFGSVELLGLFHARKLRAHQVAIERLALGLDPRRRCASPSRSTTASRPRSPCATSRCGRVTSTARWTSSRSCGLERPPQHRPAHPHALRGGLRDVAVRRGVAVGGDGDLLSAAARRARRRARAGHAVADARALRPARGAGGARALPRLPARRAARDAPARPRGGGGSARSRASSSARPGSTPRPPSASRRAAATLPARSRRTPPGPPRRPTRCCRCWRRRPGCGCSSRRGSPRTAGASGTGTAGCGCRSARTRRGSTRCSRRRASMRPASISPTCSAPGRPRSCGRCAATPGRCSCRSTAR